MEEKMIYAAIIGALPFVLLLIKRGYDVLGFLIIFLFVGIFLYKIMREG